MSYLGPILITLLVVWRAWLERRYWRGMRPDLYHD